MPFVAFNQQRYVHWRSKQPLKQHYWKSTASTINYICIATITLQYFDTVGWLTARASGLSRDICGKQLSLNMALDSMSSISSIGLDVDLTMLRPKIRSSWQYSPCFLSAKLINICPRDALHSAVYAVVWYLSVCLSVCLSVTYQYCVYTAKPIINIFWPSGSSIILDFPHRRSLGNCDRVLCHGAPNKGGVGEN